MRKTYLFIVLSLQNLFFFVSLSSQWVQTYGLPTNSQVYVITSQDQYIFAGIIDRGIYYSTTNGQNWTKCSDLYAVWSFTLYGPKLFVGNGPSPYYPSVHYTTNHGNNWINTQVYSQTYALITHGNNILAGGAHIFLSSNGGNNWITINPILNIRSFCNAGTDIFAGTYRNGIYRSSDEGYNWIQTTLDTGDFWADTSLNGIIFAGSRFNGVYKSTNNGTNWTQSGLNNIFIRCFATFNNYLLAGTHQIGCVFVIKFRNRLGSKK